MLYKSIFSMRAEPKGQSSWPVVFGPEFEPLLHDINENHPRAPSAEQGKYFTLSLCFKQRRRPGACNLQGIWGSDAGCN